MELVRNNGGQVRCAAQAASDALLRRHGPPDRRTLQPYRGWLAIVLLATTIERPCGLAAPWPLKIVLDNVIGGTSRPRGWRDIASWMPARAPCGSLRWLARRRDHRRAPARSPRTSTTIHGEHRPVGGQRSAGARDSSPRSACRSHTTTRIGPGRCSDHHRRHRDIQGFASSTTLGIVIDLLTTRDARPDVLDSDGTSRSSPVAVAPLLLLFVMRFRRAIKAATRELRQRESDLLSVVKQGLESIRVVNAFGRQELEEKHVADASQQAVQAALQARRVKSLLSPVVTRDRVPLHRLRPLAGRSLASASAMTIGSLAVFLSYLGQVLQTRAGHREDERHDRPGRGRGGAGPGNPRHRHEHPRASGRARAREAQGAIRFDRVSFGYDPAVPVLRT